MVGIAGKASHARSDRAAWQGGRSPPLHPPLRLPASNSGQGDVALLGTIDQASAAWTRAQGALLPETPASGLRRPDTHRPAYRQTHAAVCFPNGRKRAIRCQAVTNERAREEGQLSSGSEKRQRQDRLTIRFAADEMTRLKGDAERAGLTLSSYARLLVIKAEPLRQSRRPPIERQLLAKMLGQLGKTGSNLNQIARALNAATDRGATQSPILHAELRQAMAELTTIRSALMAALGRKSK